MLCCICSRYMPRWIYSLSLFMSPSTRRESSEITAGINSGKAKKRRKTAQLEKYLLARAAERSAHWYRRPVNCVLFQTSPVPGVTAGPPLPANICVTLPGRPREQRPETPFSFPFPLQFFKCTDILSRTWGDTRVNGVRSVHVVQTAVLKYMDHTYPFSSMNASYSLRENVIRKSQKVT